MEHALPMTDLQTKPQLTTIEVRNPADGSVVGAVPNDSAETVAATAADLRRCQTEWEAMGPKGRRPWLMKFQEWIFDNAEHITDVVQSETGKPRAEAQRVRQRRHDVRQGHGHRRHRTPSRRR
jgi:acyl-CoA reductase-like NAD-dependent aldehyde dehydrogenase